MKVEIDGNVYVPATEAIANAEAIVRGLMDAFWGALPANDDLKERADGLRVIVTDSPPRGWSGLSIDEVVAAIAKYSK